MSKKIADIQEEIAIAGHAGLGDTWVKVTTRMKRKSWVSSA